MKKNEVQQAPIIKFEGTNKTYKWGEKNDFPLHLLKLIGYSGLASRCIEVTARYLMGEGFRVVGESTPELDRVVRHINRDVLPQVAQNYALIPILATHVGHNAVGEVTRLHPVDTTAMRYMEMIAPDIFGGVAFCGNWKKANEKFDPQYPERHLQKFPIWNGKRAAQEAFLKGFAEKGHIYVESHLRPGDNIYPTPAWYGAANVIYLDGQIIVWQIDNIDNNFNADFVIWTEGDLSQLDENGRPLYEKVKADLRARFSGTSDKGNKGDRFVLVYSPEKSAAPLHITPIPNSGSDKMFAELYDRVHSTLTEGFGVPMALINGSQKSTLGSKELLNAAALFNNDLYPVQQRFARYFENIVKDFEGVNFTPELEIVQNVPIAEIDPEVYKRMTDEELFNYFGLNIERNEPSANNL